MPAAKYSRYYTYIRPVMTNKYVKSTAPYIFSLLAMTVFIIFAIRPTVSTILNLQKNIENHQKTYNSLIEKKNNLTLGRNNLQNLGLENRKKIITSVPDNPEVASLINNLRTASSNDASVSALQIQPVVLTDTKAKKQNTQTLGEVNFTYNVSGTYGQLQSTLYNLQRSPRILSIGNVVLSKQSEGLMVLSVSGKAYYLK